MDREAENKERFLDRLKVDEEIAQTKKSIAEQKALERQANKVEGRDWKKMFLGAARSIKPNREAIMDLYAVNPNLRESNRPPRIIRGR